QANPTNTWKLTGGVDYVFPTNQSLGDGAYLLVVNFDPSTNAAFTAAFRAKYAINPAVPLFGPYGGKLNNSDDNIELKKPTVLLAGIVPYVLVDKVESSDSLPWPAGADGFGLSLQRRLATAYGNDPTNWQAALPSAAAPTTTGGASPPVILVEPQSQSVL